MADHQYVASRELIGTLLATTSKSIRVPEWQRSYAWGKTQFEAFWMDLIDFSDKYPGDNIKTAEYFLGSVVLVTGTDHDLLLDGQQRLATSTIFLSVLRDFRQEYSGDSATRLQTKYMSDFDDATNQTTYALSLNRYDREFFRSEVQDRRPEAEKIQPTLKSHELIRRARKYFADAVEERTRGKDPKAKYDEVLRLGSVLLDSMSVVVVSSADEDNASSVFETLNDRGIGLSTPDLLRNLLIRLAPDDGAREGIIAAWQSTLVAEEEVSVDQLLRHYWVSLRGDIKARALYREIKKVVDDEKINPLTLSQDISKAAALYRDFVLCRSDSPAFAACLEEIQALGASVLYPALLSCSSASEGDDENMVDFSRALINLYVRYYLIGGREGSALENTIFKVAAALRKDKDASAAIRSVQEQAPDLEELFRQFSSVSVTRIASVRYLLRKIETHVRKTEEVKVEGPGRVHVEHIYPRNPPADRRLENHGAIVNRLGNLTLLSRALNTSIKNSKFSTKKSSYEKSAIVITKDLLAYGDEWGKGQIDTRQEWLAHQACQIWRFAGEPELANSPRRVDRDVFAELPESPVS